MAARIELGRLTLMFATALIISNPAFAQDDLPPVGRSRFDQLIGNAPVPYPFARLVKTINRQMQPDPGGLPPLKVTLIPLGRSLQRNAGAPDFFHFPRVVAAAAKPAGWVGKSWACWTGARAIASRQASVLPLNAVPAPLPSGLACRRATA